MPDEIPFRIAFLLSIVAFLAIRVYYHLKTGTFREAVASSHDSKRVRMFRPVLGVLVFGLLIVLIESNWTRWSALALPGWVRWGGVGLVSAALALLIWVYQSLGANFSPTLEIRKQHKLITTGPYRWVRHPMYSTMFLWAVGLFLITVNWITVIAPVGFALFFMLRVPDEEKMMIETFGDEYRDYMRRTGRFLPR